MAMASRAATEARSLDASRRLAPVWKPVPLSWGATIPAGAGRARNTRGAMENRQGGHVPLTGNPLSTRRLGGFQVGGVMARQSRANLATLINFWRSNGRSTEPE